MARQTVLILLAIAFCLQSTKAIEFLWGLNATYNALCPDRPYTSVSLPAGECKVGSYIMCTNGQAIAINNCQPPLRFNSTSGWCDQPENVPVPTICPVTPTVPPTCGDGVWYLPVEGSCKNYTQCLPNGFAVQRTCPYLSYYVHGKPPCVYITEPYVNDIPQQFLANCLATDPYSTITP